MKILLFNSRKSDMWAQFVVVAIHFTVIHRRSISSVKGINRLISKGMSNIPLLLTKTDVLKTSIV